MQGQYWKTSRRATTNMLAGDEGASSVKIPALSPACAAKETRFSTTGGTVSSCQNRFS
jgi:hypothetical protein